MGRGTYLEPKGEGDNSMSRKRSTRESVYHVAPQDPDDMVKATLLETQDPWSKPISLDTTL